MKLPRIESRLVELLVEEYFAWLDKKPEEVNEGIKKKLNLLLNYLDEERRSEVFRKVDFEKQVNTTSGDD